MPKKYHISTKPVPPRLYPVGKYATVEFREDCAGSCKECVKKKCVYGVFKDNYRHMSTMDEPIFLYTCSSCFRCVQECTRGIFSRVINPEYRTLGDSYYTPELIHRTWYQAHTGSIPVSGAGYRGPFVGEGFDSMWTDMSEIVRPTRDGIHGREYINTCIELSRRPLRLSFDEIGALLTEVPPILEIPMPILFQQPEFGLLSPNILLAIVKAAHKIGTLLFIRSEEITKEFTPYLESLIPCFPTDSWMEHQKLLQACKMVEIAYSPNIKTEISTLRAVKKNLFISVGAPLTCDAADIASALTDLDVDTIHFYADSHGREVQTATPRFLKEAIRDIHLRLVARSVRQKVNLIFTGGIALAEHVNKSLICGADGVVIDIPLLIAMECRVCYSCKEGLSCPGKLESVKSEYGCARIVNLMGAWRNQMLEMLGAMGLREARRLRGEVGRSMWFEDLERDSFGPIFGERKVASK